MNNEINFETETKFSYKSPEAIDQSIKKKIVDAPSEKLLREFYQNAIEHFDVSKVYVDEINVRTFSAPKLGMINNGLGMSKEKLWELQYLFDSEKNPGCLMELNNNTGARVIALAGNKLGIAYVAKHQGEIYGCFYHLRDNEDKSDFIPVFKMMNKENDSMGLIQDYGKKYGFEEWTMVITLGHKEDQNTFLEPERGLFLDDCTHSILSNRYFSQPINTRDNITPVELFIKDKQVSFYYDELQKAVGKKWLFSGELADYMIYYIENNGEVPAKSFVVHENEIFDLKWAYGRVDKVISDNSNLMRKLNATKIKENLAVIVIPKESLKIKMDEFRFNLIPKMNDIKSYITLATFESDIKEYMDEDLKEFIGSFNVHKDFECPDEIYNEMLETLSNERFDGVDLVLAPKNKEDRTIDNKESIEDKIIDSSLEELKKRFPYTSYSLTDSMDILCVTEVELRNDINKFISDTKKVVRKMIKNGFISNESSEEVYYDSLNLQLETFKPIFEELYEYSYNVKDTQTFGKLVKLYLKLLKKDINPNEALDVNRDSNNRRREITPLTPIFFNNETWEKGFKDIQNYEGLFGFYDKESISLNLDHPYFQKFIDLINLRCDEYNIPSDENLIQDIIGGTMSLMGGYYNLFNHLPSEEDLYMENVDEQDKKRNTILYMAGEYLLSTQMQNNHNLRKVIDKKLISK